MTAITILTKYCNIQFHAKNNNSGSDMARDYVWLYNYISSNCYIMYHKVTLIVTFSLLSLSGGNR